MKRIISVKTALATLPIVALLGAAAAFIMLNQQPAPPPAEAAGNSSLAQPQPSSTTETPLVAQPPANDSGKMAQLQGEVRQLREILSELLEIQGQTQGSSSALALAAPAVGDPAATQLDAEASADALQLSRAEAEQHLYNQEALFEHALGSEPVDTEWGQEITHQVQAGFAEEALSGYRLGEIRCASTLCKLEIGLDARLSKEEGLQRLAQHRSWDGATFVRSGSDGKTQIFFARTGHPLPQ